MGTGLLNRLSRWVGGTRRDEPPEIVGTLRLRAPCMSVVDVLEMPGVAKVVGEHFLIERCFGRTVALPLQDIRRIRRCRRFNGTVRTSQYQHGFWIDGATNGRLGFAVTDAAPWLAFFNEAGIAVDDTD